MLLLNIDLEKRYDPGVNIYRDLIIVSPEIGCKEGNIFLNKINNIKISKGKVIVVKRKCGSTKVDVESSTAGDWERKRILWEVFKIWLGHESEAAVTFVVENERTSEESAYERRPNSELF